MDRYPEITFAINNEFKKLEREKVTPWVFMNGGEMGPIEDFYGRTIHYKGVAFEGSPRQVFWGNFINPFLEGIFVWAFELALQFADKRGSERPPTIMHTHQCLTNGIYAIYNRMQDIDRRLRGKGFPKQVPLRDVSREIKNMEMRLQEYSDSALIASKPKAEPQEDFRLSDAIELKPKVFGVALDLKKAWKWCKTKFGQS